MLPFCPLLLGNDRTGVRESVCFFALCMDFSREQNPATEEDWQYLRTAGKRGAVLVKHGSLRMAICSLVNSGFNAEEGPTSIAIVPALLPVEWCVSDLSARNYLAPKPAKLQRSGTPTYGFYYDAPGGVVVEVSAMNIAEPA